MTAVTAVELREHAPATTWALDDATGRALAASGLVVAAPDPYTSGLWRLAAGSKVGAVTLTVPGHKTPLTLRIVPKVSVARLFFLLGYALNPKGWREDQVDLAEHFELLPALAHAFERQTERALGRGLLQGYQATEETATIMRGRIREGDQLRRHYDLAVPVELSYDEFSTDIAENQLLRAATERLLRLPGVHASVRRRLLHHRARLVDVTALPRGRDLPKWRATRLNARYHPALRLATLVLSGASVEHLAGAVRVSGFLFDMNKVFEDFVTVALREALSAAGRPGYGKLQARQNLDLAETVLMKPDFVWYDDANLPRAVVDAKYKAEKPEGFPDADLYQLLAYCIALGLTEGHLIYARGNAAHASHAVRNTGIRIHQHTVDLDQAPEPLLAELARISGLVLVTT